MSCPPFSPCPTERMEARMRDGPSPEQEWQFIEKHLARLVREPVCQGGVLKRLVPTSPWGPCPPKLPLPPSASLPFRNIPEPSTWFTHTVEPVTSLLKCQVKDNALQEKSQHPLPNMEHENQIEVKLKQKEISGRASQERRALVQAKVIAPEKEWRICSPPRQ